MHRRWYLGLCGGALAGLTGCASESPPEQDEESGGGDNESDTATPTSSRSQSSSGSAEFEVVRVESSKGVNVGETYNFAIVVRNVGDATGTFRASIEGRFGNEVRWRDVGDVEIEDVAPGETSEYISGSAEFDDPIQMEFRLAEYDYRWSLSVVVPQPAISIGETRLVTFDAGYEVRPLAAVLVTNDGEGPTESFSITADWLDNSGNYIASSKASIKTLAVGETWSARVDPFIDVDDYSEIAEFEVSVGSTTTATSLDPDGVTVSGEQLRASESQVIVRGQVQNNRDSALDYVAIVAHVYDADGVIIGEDWTNELDIGAGSPLNFELEPETYGRNGRVDSHEVIISDSSL